MMPEEEGRDAARNKMPFDSCPYTYKNSNVKNMDAYCETGNASRRDQWFRGWSDEQQKMANAALTGAPETKGK